MPAAAVLKSATSAQAGPIAAAQGHTLADMRAYLARYKPQSPSEALRLLRAAYPDSPLGLRVAACGLG